MAFYIHQGLPKICITLKTETDLKEVGVTKLALANVFRIPMGFVDCFSPSNCPSESGLIILNYGYVVENCEPLHAMLLFKHYNPRKKTYKRIKLPKSDIFSVTDLLSNNVLFAHTDI